ncbi:MAG: LptF/LptG family permease [Desulfovibrio sp.]|jgi:lipopolysaccharide export system permease protein|nr:LptF/LptG family permease [Desulfovibrio sp.]
MKILGVYLLKQNLFLISTFLCVGAGLFIITDLFERLNEFLSSGLGPGRVIYYFLLKLPNIIYLILPAVYLIAVVSQLVFLENSRERMALASGGVSPFVIMRFVIIYGVFLAAAQFVFGQMLGIPGDREAARIWQTEVRGKIFEEASVQGLWFREKQNIVHIGVVYPVAQTGENIVVYVLDEEGTGIDEIIKARKFYVTPDEQWKLEDGVSLKPDHYSAAAFKDMSLPFNQNLRVFQVVDRSMGMEPSRLSMSELYEVIKRLEQSGSNVEALKTALYAKAAYAFSIIVMGVLALIITRLTSNIYKAVALAIVIIFFYHGTNTLFVRMGEKSIVSPLVGAWLTNVIFLSCGLLRVARTFIAARLTTLSVMGRGR